MESSVKDRFTSGLKESHVQKTFAVLCERQYKIFLDNYTIVQGIVNF